MRRRKGGKGGGRDEGREAYLGNLHALGPVLRGEKGGDVVVDQAVRLFPIKLKKKRG